jgi:hypothetical protein
MDGSLRLAAGLPYLETLPRIRERKSALARVEKIPHSLNGWNLPPAQHDGMKNTLTE